MLERAAEAFGRCYPGPIFGLVVVFVSDIFGEEMNGRERGRCVLFPSLPPPPLSLLPLPARG